MCLRAQEEDELIREWKPEPLCPPMPPSKRERFIVETVTGRTVRANGQTLLNFASHNFLGLAGKEEIKVSMHLSAFTCSLSLSLSLSLSPPSASLPSLSLFPFSFFSLSLFFLPSPPVLLIAVADCLTALKQRLQKSHILNKTKLLHTIKFLYLRTRGSNPLGSSSVLSE